MPNIHVLVQSKTKTHHNPGSHSHGPPLNSRSFSKKKLSTLSDRAEPPRQSASSSRSPLPTRRGLSFRNSGGAALRQEDFGSTSGDKFPLGTPTPPPPPLFFQCCAILSSPNPNVCYLYSDLTQKLQVFIHVLYIH